SNVGLIAELLRFHEQCEQDDEPTNTLNPIRVHTHQIQTVVDHREEQHPAEGSSYRAVSPGECDATDHRRSERLQSHAESYLGGGLTDATEKHPCGHRDDYAIQDVGLQNHGSGIDAGSTCSFAISPDTVELPTEA